MSQAVVFAFACDPLQGSEPGAGAALVRLAAELVDHTVVITKAHRDIDELAAELGSNVEVIHLGSGPLGIPIHLRYLVWTVRAAAIARRLRRTRSFSVLHHATFASDWLPSPLSFLSKAAGERWVWGPVGGATYAPKRIARQMTGKLGLGEVARNAITRLLRPVSQRSMARKVDVALALNPDSMRSIRAAKFSDVRVSTNAVLDYSELPAWNPQPRTALFAGRGLSWKGLAPLIQAMEHLPEWHLIVAGPLTDSQTYRALADPVKDRVTFLGAVSRARALELMGTTSVFVLASLHDSAGWAAGEAAGVGQPVVCLPYGGVAAMAGARAVLVDTDCGSPLPTAIAEALLRAENRGGGPVRVHTAERLRATLRASYGLSEAHLP